LEARGTSSPSVVMLRSSDHLTPDEQARLIVTVLARVGEELLRDAVVGMGGDSLAGTVVSRARVVGAPPRCGGAGMEFAGCYW
jgi:hypothetical protein